MGCFFWVEALKASECVEVPYDRAEKLCRFLSLDFGCAGSWRMSLPDLMDTMASCNRDCNLTPYTCVFAYRA